MQSQQQRELQKLNYEKQMAVFQQCKLESQLP